MLRISGSYLQCTTLCVKKKIIETKYEGNQKIQKKSKKKESYVYHVTYRMKTKCCNVHAITNCNFFLHVMNTIDCVPNVMITNNTARKLVPDLIP